MTPQNKSTQGVVKTYPNTIDVISTDSQSIACFGQESSKIRVCSGNWTEVMDLAMLNLIIEEHVLDNFINANKRGRGGTTITTFRSLVIPVTRDTVMKIQVMHDTGINPFLHIMTKSCYLEKLLQWIGMDLQRGCTQHLLVLLGHNCSLRTNSKINDESL
uniref:Uncharacterized protein n=1 Tax=Ananas comosus var. bracteatus TaxID=296719 RepID=A0A6V7Q5Y1_ANACO|nr:unnamed protein product [Ananas comosus var. bracteatus]